MSRTAPGPSSAIPALPVAGTGPRTLPRSLRPLLRLHDAMLTGHRPEVLATLLAGALYTWKVTAPSPWWDEAVTVDVVGRPVNDLLALTSSIDLVHLVYYLVAHALLGSDASLTALRMISVVAGALTAGLLVRLGRELGSRAVGITAAAMFVVAPLSTRYSQEARSYALVALVATASTIALVRVCRRPWRRRRWVAYAALVVATAALNLLAVLVLLPHAVYVLVTAPRAVLRRWLVAATGAALVLWPLVIGAGRQRGQVSWLPVPQVRDIWRFYEIQYARGALVAVLLLVVAVAGLRWPVHDGQERGTHRDALLLGASWALLPPLVLWTVSQAHPLYDLRYVYFTVPGTALALASLVTLVRPLLTVLLVAALAIGGLHMQDVYRYRASGHAEDIRGAASIIQDSGRAGDAVVFVPGSRRIVKLAYPEKFAAVDDIALSVDPVASATLFGVEQSGPDVRRALRARTRVWVITGSPRLGEVGTAADQEKEHILALGFRLAQRYEAKRYDVLLYVRDRPVVVPPQDLARSVPPVTR